MADKHAELERNYARMQRVERQSAITEEHGRIMSDMHDGIGAQLISTLSLVEHGDASSKEVATVLRECIDDLRLAIVVRRQTAELGHLGYLPVECDTVGLQSRFVLHVLRILQDAFTTVLKHAKANRIRVDTQLEDGAVAVRISDNGAGFSDEPSAKGHGLSNMRARAKAIGASLQVTQSASGATLLLPLPIG